MALEEALDILQPDIYWCGGLSETLKIAAYATVHDLISGGSDAETIPKADHRQVVPLVLKSQHLRPAFDILGTCRLQYMEIGLETKYYEELYYYATGKKLDFDKDLLTQPHTCVKRRTNVSSDLETRAMVPEFRLRRH